MAAPCLAITAVTGILAEHLDVISELKLHQTCSCIHKGNQEHLKVLAKLRSFKLGTCTAGAEGQKEIPHFYQVCLEIRLEQLYDRWPHLIPDVN